MIDHQWLSGFKVGVVSGGAVALVGIVIAACINFWIGRESE